MSRVANIPVEIPKGVEVTISGQDVRVKGSKGELTYTVHRTVLIELQEQEVQGSTAKIITVKLRKNFENDKEQAGTTRALLNNMVIGVHKGFNKKLQLNGVGYRAQAKGKTLTLSLGYSHPIEYSLPPGIEVETPSVTEIIISGVDKQKVGQAAAEIREFRKPEPYKGKGVCYANERILRKEVKKK